MTCVDTAAILTKSKTLLLHHLTKLARVRVTIRPHRKRQRCLKTSLQNVTMTFIVHVPMKLRTHIANKLTQHPH